MNPQVQHLIALQGTDHDISDLKKNLKHVPEQIKKTWEHLSQEQEKLYGLQQEIQAAQKKRNQLEQEVLKEKDHMAKVKVKLPGIKTNREYSPLLMEVNTIMKKETVQVDFLDW